MFHDVSEKSVYELDPHPLKHKLRCSVRQFRDPEGYLWAWSDTCCIDKTIELFTGSQYAPCTTVSGTKSQFLLSYSSPVDPHRPLSRKIHPFLRQGLQTLWETLGTTTRNHHTSCRSWQRVSASPKISSTTLQDHSASEPSSVLFRLAKPQRKSILHTP